MATSITVPAFLLMSIAEVWKLRFLHSMLFPKMCLAALIGDLLIITATILHQNLHIPMHFYLRILSILDMCFISVTVPKAYVTTFTDKKVISLIDFVQQLVLPSPLLSLVEISLLTDMAQRHYLAIHQPFHYPEIMNYQLCLWMTLATLLCGLVCVGVHTGNLFLLYFFQSNIVHQFFCDIPSLLRLSCSETFNNELIILVSQMGFGVGHFIFFVISFISIFSSVLKFATLGE